MSVHTFGWLSHQVQCRAIIQHNPLTVYSHMVALYHASTINHHMSIIYHLPHLLSIIDHQYCPSHFCNPPINHDTIMTITKHQLLGKQHQHCLLQMNWVAISSTPWATMNSKLKTGWPPQIKSTKITNIRLFPSRHWDGQAFSYNNYSTSPLFLCKHLLLQSAEPVAALSQIF